MAFQKPFQMWPRWTVVGLCLWALICCVFVCIYVCVMCVRRATHTHTERERAHHTERANTAEHTHTHTEEEEYHRRLFRRLVFLPFYVIMK